MLSLIAPKTEFDAPSPVYAFLKSPVAFIARRIYKFINLLRLSPAKSPTPLRVVCISDTHTQITEIPDGDLLIHAGDLTNAGTVKEIQEQIDWLDSLPHQEKIVIAGNHDTYLDPRSRRTLPEPDRSGQLDWKGIHYLQHSSVTLIFPAIAQRKFKIYGAPQIPACGGPEFAFQYQRGQDAWAETVPIDTDILVTHTPPKFHMDLPTGLGCEYLLRESWRVKPRLHVFGHVHAGSGSEVIWWNGSQASYERICARSNSFFSFLKPNNWLDMTRLCLFGTRDIAWTLLWRGEAHGSMLVNAALMSQVTGCLENVPRVVEI